MNQKAIVRWAAHAQAALEAHAAGTLDAAALASTLILSGDEIRYWLSHDVHDTMHLDDEDFHHFLSEGLSL